MDSSHGSIRKGICTVGLEALRLGTVAEQIGTEGLQGCRHTCLIHLGIGIGGNAVFIPCTVVGLTILCTVEDRGKAVIHLYRCQAVQGEVVVAPLLHRQQFNRGSADLGIALVGIHLCEHIDCAHVEALQQGLGNCEVHRNITCQIQGVIDLQTVIKKGLRGKLPAQDGVASVDSLRSSCKGIAQHGGISPKGLSIDLCTVCGSDPVGEVEVVHRALAVTVDRPYTGCSCVHICDQAVIAPYIIAVNYGAVVAGAGNKAN